MIFANGDLSSFEVSLQREGGGEDARASTPTSRPTSGCCCPARSKQTGPPVRAARRHEPIPQTARGFTLLEVLIALAIVAMSVGALLGTVTSSASNIIYLKEKTLAEWVALNRLTEIRIAQADARQGQTHRQRRDGRHALAVGRGSHASCRSRACSASTCARAPPARLVDDSRAGRRSPLRRR